MAKQASIMAFVKVKNSGEVIAYRFLTDMPEFMLPSGKTAGPFRLGDLVSKEALPPEVWHVLLSHAAVKPYRVRPNYPLHKH